VKKAGLVLSDAAVADVLDQADWYIQQSGRTLALRWEKAVTSAISYVLRNPAAGAPCTFRSAELEGVRRAAIPRFPKHLLFYRFDGEEVLVLRIVHGARDLERLLEP
jgi:toxin ParE1/3/4